jgi:Spy/CpxP family protein refolding chaperone
MRTVKTLAAAATLALGMSVAATGPASADPPGPGDKQCSPGKNNVGGGPGKSGPGDKHGAPLKAPKSCPGR